MYIYLHVHGIVKQSLDGLKQSITLELQRIGILLFVEGLPLVLSISGFKIVIVTSSGRSPHLLTQQLVFSKYITCLSSSYFFVIRHLIAVLHREILQYNE